MRSLEARLRKVEATTPQIRSDAPVLWVFGHDRADLERRLAAEMEAGRLRDRTMAIEVIWRGDEPLPATRWMKVGDLTPEEDEDWFATLMVAPGLQPHARGDREWIDDIAVVIGALRTEVERRDTAARKGAAADTGTWPW